MRRSPLSVAIFSQFLEGMKRIRSKFKSERGMMIIGFLTAAAMIGVVAMAWARVAANMAKASSFSRQNNELETIKSIVKNVLADPEACRKNITSYPFIFAHDGWGWNSSLYDASGNVILMRNGTGGTGYVGRLRIDGFYYKIPSVSGPVGVSQSQLRVDYYAPNNPTHVQSLYFDFGVWVGGRRSVYFNNIPATIYAKSPFKCAYPGEPKRGHLLFVSSQVYNGNLGGLAGADAKCQALADAPTDGSGIAYGTTGAYGGTWRAILSDGTTSAKSRINIMGPVFNHVGDMLARNAGDFWDGNLLTSPVNNAANWSWKYNWNSSYTMHYVDRFPETPGSALTWTGSTGNGLVDPDGLTCNSWTDISAALNGKNAYTWYSNSEWLARSGYNSCASSYRLYCISLWSP
jgi:hypothetical protein